MHEEAIDWAASVLGSAVTESVPLSGGMTSTMLALTDGSGTQSVLRLMTKEPWRTHGAELTRRESAAQRVLTSTAIPAPTSIALDADGDATGVPAHLMSRLPGARPAAPDGAAITTMVDMLVAIQRVRPPEPFRSYQSWAWPAKWVIPTWTRHPGSWRRAFQLLAEGPPSYEPTLLHRDYSHRNLLYEHGAITGVVDWVETSTGPAWLDAAHAATSLAVDFGSEIASSFLAAYESATTSGCETYWLVMDAVGFLPPPGRPALFGSDAELDRLDRWVHGLVSNAWDVDGAPARGGGVRLSCDGSAR